MLLFVPSIVTAASALRWQCATDFAALVCLYFVFILVLHCEFALHFAFDCISLQASSIAEPRRHFMAQLIAYDQFYHFLRCIYSQYDTFARLHTVVVAPFARFLCEQLRGRHDAAFASQQQCIASAH
jgi:hypothetical protein